MSCCCSSSRSGLMLGMLGAAIVISSAIGSVWLDGDGSKSTASSGTLEDAITGDWEGEASGDDLPEDLQLFVSLEMDEDSVVTGVFTVSHDDAPFEGSFDPESNVLTGTVTDPDGPIWEMALKLDDDELEGEATEKNSGATVDVSLERSEE